MVAKAQALVLEGPRRMVPVELDLPEVRDDDAVLRVEACGLCGTDHELFTGELAWPTYGFVPGHETVGVIEEIGPLAAKRWGVKRGDRVAVETFQSCRACARCLAGDYKKCERHGAAEMYGFISASRAPGLWGGYATHHYLAPDSMVLPMAADIDPVVATFFNPLGGGFKWAAEVGEIQPGDRVAVLGPGVRGLSALIAAKEAGAAFVMVTGFGARDRGRLEFARRFGADLVVDVAQEDPVAAFTSASGSLADLIVDVTANSPAALMQAMRLARVGGRIVIVGVRGKGEVPGFEPDLILTKELRIQGTMGVDVRAYRRALEVLASGRYPIDELPRRVASLAGVGELLSVMAGEGGSEPPVHAVLVPG
ncbi:MAG: alcohol dehydrogenase [Actinomycetia bacterium]|nr:alcohol dehydrogenase [Actinomycetes bacterium]